MNSLNEKNKYDQNVSRATIPLKLPGLNEFTYGDTYCVKLEIEEM